MQPAATKAVHRNAVRAPTTCCAYCCCTLLLPAKTFATAPPWGKPCRKPIHWLLKLQRSSSYNAGHKIEVGSHTWNSPCRHCSCAKPSAPIAMKIVYEGWDPADKQPVRGTLMAVDRAQTQAADLVTVQLQHGQPVILKQNPTALRGGNVRVGACAWDGAYVLSAYLDAQPPGTFAGLRCVELGAGMGLVGLVLARLGAAVHLTDKPCMTVHARVNAAKNKLLAAAAPAAPAAVGAKQLPQQQDLVRPSPGMVAVVGLDWEDAAAAATAAASITAQGPVDLIVATDCIYPDPSGSVPSSSGFMAAVQALCSSSSSSSSMRTRVLVSFEARSDELRQALLGAAAAVPGGCSVQQLDQQQLPQGYRCSHIELYELKLGV